MYLPSKTEFSSKAKRIILMFLNTVHVNFETIKVFYKKLHLLNMSYKNILLI